MSIKLWGTDPGGTKIEGAVLKSKDDQEVLVKNGLIRNLIEIINMCRTRSLLN